MRSILLATAVLAPLGAHTTPIYDFIDVHYEGTVDSLQPWAGGFPDAPKVGDRFAGTLRVDLHKLPKDTDYPGDPTRSNRYASSSYDIPSFVSGYAPRTARDS